MIVLMHVLIALSSIAMTTAAYIAPTQHKLRTNYVLIAATLISGTYLVVSTHSGLISACTTGLIYLSVVSFGTALARHKLLKATNN
ncbi:MAG: hypothetical protein U0524_00410 [Candidatus Saccharimonadales bacterium]